MFRPAIKLFFIARAAYEVGRERVEDALDSVTAKAGEYKSTGSDQVHDMSEKAKQVLGELTQNIWQAFRSPGKSNARTYPPPGCRFLARRLGDTDRNQRTARRNSDIESRNFRAQVHESQRLVTTGIKIRIAAKTMVPGLDGHIGRHDFQGRIDRLHPTRLTGAFSFATRT